MVKFSPRPLDFGYTKAWEPESKERNAAHRWWTRLSFWIAKNAIEASSTVLLCLGCVSAYVPFCSLSIDIVCQTVRLNQNLLNATPLAFSFTKQDIGNIGRQLLDCEERDWGVFVESQNSLPHKSNSKEKHLKNIFLPQTKRWKADAENLCSKWSKSLQRWRLQIPYRSDGGGDVHREGTEDVPKWDHPHRFKLKCFDFVKSMPKWESTRLTQNTFETHCSGDVCRFHMDRRWHGQRHSKVRQSPPSSLLVILRQ